MIRQEIEEKASKSLINKLVDTIIITVLMFGIMFIVNKVLELILAQISIDIYIKYTLLLNIIIIFVPLVVMSFLGFGFLSYFLKISRNENVTFKELFTKINMFFSYLLITFFIFLLISIVMLIMLILVIYLKIPLPLPVLAIIPMALALSCSLTYFVKLDNPSLGIIGSFKKSMELMKGNKWKLFKLFMSVLAIYFIVVMIFVLTYVQYVGFEISFQTTQTTTHNILDYLIPAISIFWFIPYFLTTLSVFYNNLVNKNEDPLNRTLNIETNSGANNNSTTFPESIESETHTKEDIKEMMEKQKELISNVENQMDKVENNENVTQTIETQPVSTETNNFNI